MFCRSIFLNYILDIHVYICIHILDYPSEWGKYTCDLKWGHMACEIKSIFKRLCNPFSTETRGGGGVGGWGGGWVGGWGGGWVDGFRGWILSTGATHAPVLKHLGRVKIGTKRKRKLQAMVYLITRVLDSYFIYLYPVLCIPDLRD